MRTQIGTIKIKKIYIPNSPYITHYSTHLYTDHYIRFMVFRKQEQENSSAKNKRKKTNIITETKKNNNKHKKNKIKL